MNSVIASWNPFRDLERFERRLTTGNFERAWTPPVDVVEDEKHYAIHIDLPQVAKEDIKVKIEDGYLAISGERKHVKEEAGKTYHRLERGRGTFARTFVLPEDSDPQAVSAEFKDGLLSVSLPKKESAQPKLVDVKVN